MSIVVPAPSLESTVIVPPSSESRSRIERSPTPKRASAGNPRPSSLIDIASWFGSARSSMRAAVAPACRAILVNASCVMRKTATSTAAESDGIGSGSVTVTGSSA